LKAAAENERFIVSLFLFFDKFYNMITVQSSTGTKEKMRRNKK
jgi:hypothetical protein